MDKNKLIQTLIGLKNTLNIVEIRGQSNIDCMSISLKAIDNLLMEINKEDTVKIEK